MLQVCFNFSIIFPLKRKKTRLQDAFILQCPDYSLKKIERSVFHPDTLPLMGIFTRKCLFKKQRQFRQLYINLGTFFNLTMFLFQSIDTLS